MTQDNASKNLPQKRLKPVKHQDPQDLEFMSSLSRAVLEKPTRSSQLLVWMVLLIIIWLLTWAHYAELDKIVRAYGKVVPSSKVQVVQNLEGGIVADIFFRTGDRVQKGDTLLQLDNTLFASSFSESKIRSMQLSARAQRLQAEAFEKPLSAAKNLDNPLMQDLFEREYQLYQARQQQLQTQEAILQAQIEQHKIELREAYSQEAQLKRSYALLSREIDMMRPLVKQGIASEVDLLKLQREENDAAGRLTTVRNRIPRLQSVISEAQNTLKQAREEFRNQAHEQLNEVLAEISQIEQSSAALADRVRRTSVTSPVNGTIKQLLVNTIGGVVQPGSDIVEIVPNDDTLVLEAKVLPADIGFLYPGLQAKVKFTAYDFSIYGGLDATLISLSADTITDAEGHSFYIARLQTHKNALGTEEKPLYLMPGMTASVDIIVGKHSILDYILKPIIKTKELALRES